MQNKPNLLDTQMNVTIVLTKHYEQITMNNEPKKQTQTKPNKLEANLPPKGAEIPTGELLGILKPWTNQTQFIVSLPALSKPVPSAVEGVEVSNLLQTNHPIFKIFVKNTYFLTFLSFSPPFF
jgi:hypothetical protein